MAHTEDNEDEGDDGVAVATSRPKLKRPPLYTVLLLNDDYTPMEFVVHVLEQFFNFSREKSVQVMLQVHNDGQGVCGTFTRDVAETKVTMINDYAKENQHPLLCTMELA